VESKIKILTRYTTLIAIVIFISATGVFLFNSYNSYNIASNFTAIPLMYDPYESISEFNWNGSYIKVRGGFIKGIQRNNSNESLVIRALSPLPEIEIENLGNNDQSLSIYLENIDPEFYAMSLREPVESSRNAVNSLELKISIETGNKVYVQPSDIKAIKKDSYVILGDNRDGYDTFQTIITQVNSLKPAFVIDNGDLVFSGKPNQYRLFDNIISKVGTTVCTTLGNHDIRGNGREIYTMLYGPPYYSFDYDEMHYIFLDSSRGYAEKQAIPDEQYIWLEKDLKKSRGKKIFVISHVPSTDPRSGLLPNEIEAYTDKVKKEGTFVDRKLEEYSTNAAIDHGFRDEQEASKFENLMSEYNVDSVFLSHIHSYSELTKNGIRYVISGGAGAELMTKNSYYHYLVSSLDGKGIFTMIQLPSPSNTMVQRFASTISLFSKAMYKENQIAVTLLLSGFYLVLALILLSVFMKYRKNLILIWLILKDLVKYIPIKYKELKKEAK